MSSNMFGDWLKQFSQQGKTPTGKIFYQVLAVIIAGLVACGIASVYVMQ